MKNKSSFFSNTDKPFIIAEMSGNHKQSLDRALEIVEAAAKAGASALKLQTYTADTMTLDLDDGDFFISDERSPWAGQSLHALYDKASTPWEWHAPIFKRAQELGMVAFSSPFDASSVDFLETLDVPCYKIASFENTDIPLIKKVASQKKPMIISAGMATLEELTEAVKVATDFGCPEIVLLKCTSTYPASPENINLATIPHMRETLGCQVGLSDHTLGVGVAVASIALGVRVIEKHFTLSRSDGAVDSKFSMEPEEFAVLVREVNNAAQSIGSVKYGPTEAEEFAVTRRRSIYVSKFIKAGEKITADNVRVVRPGYGLAPKHYDDIMGKKLLVDVKKGTPLSWSMVESD